MQWLKQHRFAVVATACVLAVLWLYFSSDSFQRCIESKQNADAEKSFYESVSQFLDFLGVLRGCTGYFIDQAGPAITALATILIAIFTWTLWRTSAKQAELTVIAIDDASKASQRELRAYVLLESAHVEPLRVKGEEQFHVALNIKNFGQTPAYKVRTSGGFRYLSTGIDSPFTEDEIFNQENLLGPGGEQTTDLTVAKSIIPTPEDPKLKGVFVKARIDYLDAFQRPQWITLRHELRGNGADGTYYLAPCGEGNDAS